MKIEINSDDDLSLEKVLKLQNAIIFFEFIFNNKFNHYRHDVHLVKRSYKLAK